MNVVFLGPCFPPEMRDFTRGLKETGARVFGVGDGPVDPRVKPYLDAYLRVPSLTRGDDVHARVLEWVRGESIDDVIGNWEPTMLTAARLRESLQLPGMSSDAVMGFRDKPLMRSRVAAAGVRVPRTLRATTVHEVLEAAQELNFPLVLKPVDGAGSADTFIIRDLAELKRQLPAMIHLTEVSVEEFIQGQEFTYETISINGSPVFEGMSRYEPNTLNARQNEWISPIIQSLSHLNAPHLRKARLMGQRAMKALGMGTGFTHMEWFLTNQGEVIFGEIACRSPGANMVDLMNFAGDIDLYSAWGQAVIHGGIRQLNPRNARLPLCLSAPPVSVVFNVSPDSEPLSISTARTSPALIFCRLVPAVATGDRHFFPMAISWFDTRTPKRPSQWRAKQPGKFSSTRARDVTNISRMPLELSCALV